MQNTYKNQLSEQIHLKKLELFQLVSLYGLNSIMVLNSSRKLDKLINEYQLKSLLENEQNTDLVEKERQ
ncbi:aspartyl-phosphate phosphatase Spo0E family protein [Mesobacillus harenae]|uniref:aspartyl-phosphate phosphatase Spo0E family protein n=1 Tax=Mesobacillus harenae TaxID=2213203 RepID=UPI00157FECD1|nr:aspartyl-phosphate phosphatase Spo0E family protein [Mesobacillus harenae]